VSFAVKFFFKRRGRKEECPIPSRLWYIFVPHCPPLYRSPKKGYNGTCVYVLLVRSHPVKNKYSLACYAIVLIVLLRVGIGWHFFYEGVNKFDPASNFSAEGFLGIAKGPTADLYYWILPDIDGVNRLELAEIKDENERDRKTFRQYENAWKDYFKTYLLTHMPLIKDEKHADEFINLGTEKFADWIREKAPQVVTENIVELNTAQLTAWAENRVPSADAIEHVIAAKAEFSAWKEWAEEKKLPPAQINQYTDSMQTQFKDWAEQNLALATARDVIAMDDTQLAEWAARNTPLSDTSKGDAVLEVKALIRAKTIFNRYLHAMRTSAAELEQEVGAFRASRDRFLETRRTIRNDTSFEQQRRWQQMMGFRAEASLLTRTLSAMGDSMQSELGRLADPELAGQRGQIITAPKRGLFPDNPLIQIQIPEVRIPVVDAGIKSRLHVLDWAVTFGLTAIGLCLMLGFCTRLAALGGALFLVNVVLTTYPVPGVYPEIPSFVGNFMFVSKDMVELLALLVVAAVPAGRWGGLDFFLWHYGGKQIFGFFCFWSKKDDVPKTA